jgi:hypothetical protein
LIDVFTLPQWVESLKFGDLPPEPPFSTGGNWWRPDRDEWIELLMGLALACIALDIVISLVEMRAGPDAVRA